MKRYNTVSHLKRYLNTVDNPLDEIDFLLDQKEIEAESLLHQISLLEQARTLYSSDLSTSVENGSAKSNLKELLSRAEAEGQGELPESERNRLRRSSRQDLPRPGKDSH